MVKVVIGHEPIEISLDSLKLIYIKGAKDKTNKELACSDWYVVRESETGTATPEDVTSERAILRSKCNEYEALVNACETKEALKALGVF